jgi:hypothetical protein
MVDRIDPSPNVKFQASISRTWLARDDQVQTVGSMARIDGLAVPICFA